MANCLLLCTPSSRMGTFFAVLLCCMTCSASSGLIVSAPTAMNVSLNSLVTISCSSSDTTASIALFVIGVTVKGNDVVMDGLKTTSAQFNATVNLNGTNMFCSVDSQSGFENSHAVTLLIQGPPSAPSNPVPQPIDACSKKITWEPPFTLDGVPLFYNLTITSTSTQEIVDYASIEDEEYILSPRDLTETYTVHIKAWNAAGSSDEVDFDVSFTTEDFDAVFNNLGRNGVTWILNFTALNTCVSQTIADATIKLCPISEDEQPCEMFHAPKENIEQFMDGELRLSFPVYAQDQGMYESRLCVHYESGQEMYSQSSFPIDTSDIRSVEVSSDSNGMACFSVTQIPGSLLHGMVVQFNDRGNGNSITRVVVVDNDNSLCIKDLPTGHYSISVGELNAPLLSIDEEVSIEAESTSTTATSTEMIVIRDQSAVVAAIVGSITGILILLVLIVAVIVLICSKYYCTKDKQRYCLRGTSIRAQNRISDSLKGDISGCAEFAQGPERHVEHDGIPLEPVLLTAPDPDQKVRAPIQVSERERSPQIYKPSV